MLRIEYTGNVVTVGGNPEHVAMFYCIWQSEIFPKWAEHVKNSNDEDAMPKQVRYVMDRWSTGQPITLSNEDDGMTRAVFVATAACEKLGIELEVKDGGPNA